MNRSHKAIALMSGGLDSILAVLHMQRLGYEVTSVFFQTPFFGPKRAIETARQAGIDLLVHDITDIHLGMLKAPKYGFGRFINPCIDCHGLMFREASSLLEKYNAHFFISGEVLGQRPMSQRLDALNAVRKLSGVGDLIVRPLSQRLLPDTLPIREGWVAKEEMLDIQGRTRRRQIELAAEYGVTDYPNSAGGCLLTDKGYALRLKDLIDHDMLEMKYISLLPFGRHFRLNENFKLVVGKTSGDNNSISTSLTDETVLKIMNIKGPMAVLSGRIPATENELRLAASILVYFTDSSLSEAPVNYGLNYHLDNRMTASPIRLEDLEPLWLKL